MKLTVLLAVPPVIGSYEDDVNWTITAGADGFATFGLKDPKNEGEKVIIRAGNPDVTAKPAACSAKRIARNQRSAIQVCIAPFQFQQTRRADFKRTITSVNVRGIHQDI